MPDNAFSHDVEEFVHQLDDATQAHMAWTRRVLRCAVLHCSPGPDVLAEDAHRRCIFGDWFSRHREQFDALNAQASARLDEQHRLMHDTVRGICQGVIAGAAGDPAMLDAFERSQASVLADLAFLKTECLARSARLDALTGLPLRHSLEEEFSRCRAQAMRRGELMVAVMLDVDHFKHVNDAHGHAAGDQALQHVAQLLAGNCRAGEPLFRYGGEEFLALLLVADREAAQQGVERLLQALRDTPLTLPTGQLLNLRASAGLAQVHAAEPAAHAVACADRALYTAKAAGRDTWRWG